MFPSYLMSNKTQEKTFSRKGFKYFSRLTNSFSCSCTAAANDFIKLNAVVDGRGCDSDRTSFLSLMKLHHKAAPRTIKTITTFY